MAGSIDTASALQKWMVGKAKQLTALEIVSLMQGCSEATAVSEIPVLELTKAVRHAKLEGIPEGSRRS